MTIFKPGKPKYTRIHYLPTGSNVTTQKMGKFLGKTSKILAFRTILSETKFSFCYNFFFRFCVIIYHPGILKLLLFKPSSGGGWPHSGYLCTVFWIQGQITDQWCINWSGCLQLIKVSVQFSFKAYLLFIHISTDK